MQWRFVALYVQFFLLFSDCLYIIRCKDYIFMPIMVVSSI